VFTTSCAGHLSSDVLFKVLADWVCPLESTMDSKESIVLFAPRLIPPSFSPFWGMTSLPVYLLKSETWGSFWRLFSLLASSSKQWTNNFNH
jgi:hypothetical protein